MRKRKGIRRSYGFEVERGHTHTARGSPEQGGPHTNGGGTPRQSPKRPGIIQESFGFLGTRGQKNASNPFSFNSAYPGTPSY